MNKRKIIFLGDSVLDDFFWLQMPKQDVRQQLEDLLSSGDRVVNYAVDESCIQDVLRGLRPRDQYIDARHKHFRGTYPYPTDNFGYVNPLNLLKNAKSTHVVVSAGGNDGRVHLSKLAISADSLIQAILDDGFEEKYEMMLKKVLTIQPQAILVQVYKPHENIFKEFFGNMGWGLGFFGGAISSALDLPGRLDQVYDRISEIILNIASKYNVPVINLATTFNPKDRSHYGSTSIEPSNKSGMTIAKLIQYVVENHNFSGDSMVYYAPYCGEIAFEFN